MQEIILNWSGPYTFKDILTEPEIGKYNCSGVYLWKEEYNGKAHIEYLGRAMKTTLVSRHVNHYLNLIGGTYTIKRPPDWEKRWEPNVKKNRVFLETILDEEKFHGLVNDCFRYLNHLKLYFGIPENPDNVDLKVVERNLICYCQPEGTKMGKMSKPKELISILNKGELTSINEMIPEGKQIKERYYPS